MFALRNEKFRLFIGKALYHDFEVLFSHFHPEVFFCISISYPLHFHSAAKRRNPLFHPSPHRRAGRETVPQRLKPLGWRTLGGTAEAGPLTKTAGVV